MPDVSKPQPSASSPLAIIALFIGLSEATAGAGAIGTDGTSRLILSVFAVTFPLLVFGVFVWLVLNHPGNLYRPDQFTETTTIDAFVGGLRRQTLASQAVLESAIADAVSAAITAHDEGGDATPAGIVATVDRAVALAVRQGGITVLRDQIVPGAKPITLPVSEETTVQDLLDAIWFSFDGAVPPFTYGRQWWLALEDGTGFPEIGGPWAKRHRGLAVDERLLASVGIRAGMSVVAKPILGAPHFY